jgi:hypothetical protein
LRLTTTALEGCYRKPGRFRGHRRAMVLADQMQAQVHAGRSPGRGQKVAVIDIEHIGFNLYPGIPSRELRRKLPMSRRAPSVKETGRREHEGTAANRSDTASARGSPTNGGSDIRRDRRSDVSYARHNERVSSAQCREPVVHPDFTGGAS